MIDAPVVVVQEAAGTASNVSPVAAPAREAYQVPADFDAAQLGQPDFSSKQMAERSLPAVFLKRWLDLRDQVYNSGGCYTCIAIRALHMYCYTQMML